MQYRSDSSSNATKVRPWSCDPKLGQGRGGSAHSTFTHKLASNLGRRCRARAIYFKHFSFFVFVFWGRRDPAYSPSLFGEGGRAGGPHRSDGSREKRERERERERFFYTPAVCARPSKHVAAGATTVLCLPARDPKRSVPPNPLCFRGPLSEYPVPLNIHILKLHLFGLPSDTPRPRGPRGTQARPLYPSSRRAACVVNTVRSSSLTFLGSGWTRTLTI
jgi:hypothetical protein